MKFSNKLTLIFLTSFGITYPSLPVTADIETTTVQTTTTSTGDSLTDVLEKRTTTETKKIVPTVKTIVLPATSTYLLVDPVTGQVKGTFDPNSSTASIQTISPGTIVIDQVSGRIMATISSTGQVVDVVTAPALDPMVAAIDSRRAEIDQRITSALSSGTIDTKQASALRAQLAKIANKEAAARQRTGGIPYSEALTLSLELNNLSDRLVLFAHGPVITPLLGSSIVSSNGELLVVDSVTYKRYQLSQRIDDEYAAGRLSNKQVSDLKEELNSIASLDSKYRRNGQLDASHSAKIASKLDTMESRMNKDVATINDKRAKIGIKVD